MTRSEQTLEGVPGRWRVYAVLDDRPLVTAGGYEADVRQPPPDPSPLAAFELTPREHEVLDLVAKGHSNGEIAQELFISRKTVSVHVSHILQKLGANSRGQAAAIAHRATRRQHPT